MLPPKYSEFLKLKLIRFLIKKNEKWKKCKRKKNQKIELEISLESLKSSYISANKCFYFARNGRITAKKYTQMRVNANLR